MSLSIAFVTGLALRIALAFLSLVAFAGVVAVPAEGGAIRRWGRGSRPHKAVNGLLYLACVALVLVVLFPPLATAARQFWASAR